MLFGRHVMFTDIAIYTSEMRLKSDKLNTFWYLMKRNRVVSVDNIKKLDECKILESFIEKKMSKNKLSVL